MPHLYAALAPETASEAARLAAAAACHRAELETFRAEIESGMRALLPTDRCLVWRSAAADAYDMRLGELGDRLAAVVAVVGDACEAQQRQAVRLQVIADAPGAL